MNRKSAIIEMRAVFEVLSNDIEEIREYGKSNKSEFAERTLLRTHFAFIEGMTHQLKLVALCAASEHPSIFTSKELTVLKEEQYSLNKKGEIETKDNYQKLMPMMLFTINCYTKAHGGNYKPKTGVHGWEAMKDYLKIRNNLMHPKSTSDLKLDDNKLKISIDAAEWFKKTMQEMFDNCSVDNTENGK